ncbi:MAG: peroxiredoxin [Muribaculaceae bacterium]|nr:peroxiredoxin [Muribaculaceae bacterium]
MEIGDKFPNLLGTDAQGKEVKLSDYPGKKFVLYFYPKDNTPGCSAEACSLNDGLDELAAKGYQVIGVSKDSAASHIKFADKFGLKFPLVADTDTTLCQLAGVWQKKKMAGREYMGIVRTTFLLSPDGTVEQIISKVNTKDAANQILGLIEN